MTQPPRVLISTITPNPGGVDTMTGFVVRMLRDWGLRPVIAHYQPYSQSPELSVPSFRLGRARVGARVGHSHGDCETHAIGAWLPELEFTHYLPTRHWRELMDGCAAFIAVSGNVLAATPFARSGRPYVAWVATDWEGDRRDRVRGFPWPRKLLDRCVNAPVIRRLERELLSRGHTLALSEHTARALNALTPTPSVRGLLPMPVDGARFHPDPEARVPGRIGFSGRIDDPRKNIPLLLEAYARLRQQGVDVSLRLVGGTVTAAISDAVRRFGLEGQVEFVPHVSADELAQHLRTLDFFVLPSHQEGLCIAALEAMACGVPVISTRCGGPEEFVLPGHSGQLVGFDAEEMAQAIAQLLRDRALHGRLAAGARRVVEHRYTFEAARQSLRAALWATFPQLQNDLDGGPSLL